MITSNALEDLKTLSAKDYCGIAERMIAALKSHGSDRVRDALNGIRGFDFAYILGPLANLFECELSKSADDDDKAKYVYGVPFFCRPEEETEEKGHTRMSGDVTNADRTSIKIEECIHYQIHFDHFDVM